MTDAGKNKELVSRWLASGPWTEEGRSLVTTDFVWQAPRSAAAIFGSPDAALRGPEELKRLPEIEKAVYANDDVAGPAAPPVMIAEGDTVVLEFQAIKNTHAGQRYHNYYVFVVRIEDGKIAELREYTDTKHFHNVVMSTPSDEAAVLDRLSHVRSQVSP